MSQSIIATSNCPDPSIGIESSLASLGCIFDENGEIIGKVFVCKKQEDIVDGEITYELVAYLTDGSDPVQPYTGPWADCNNCPVGDAPGFTTI